MAFRSDLVAFRSWIMPLMLHYHDDWDWLVLPCGTALANLLCILPVHSFNAYFQQCGQMMLETSDFGLILSKLWPRKLHFAVFFLHCPWPGIWYIHNIYIYIYIYVIHVIHIKIAVEQVPLPPSLAAPASTFPKLKMPAFPMFLLKGASVIFYLKSSPNIAFVFHPLMPNSRIIQLWVGADVQHNPTVIYKVMNRQAN